MRAGDLLAKNYVWHPDEQFLDMESPNVILETVKLAWQKKRNILWFPPPAIFS